jgi:hypothetical protein
VHQQLGGLKPSVTQRRNHGKNSLIR